MHSPGFRLGIDFGTSHTVAILRWPDGRAKPLLFDSSPVLPSAVYAEPSGSLATGRDAVHSARIDPTRFEPNPKRRIDDGTTLLGDAEFKVCDLIAAVLARVAEEVRRTAGGVPAAVTLTCPATWGASRRSVLTAAAADAGLGTPALVEEPVAAATYFAQLSGRALRTGSAVVVYDLGGGTFDVSVVTRTPDGFHTVAVAGRDDIGGLDLDHALVRRIGDVHGAADPPRWQRLANPTTPTSAVPAGCSGTTYEPRRSGCRGTRRRSCTYRCWTVRCT
ncbi:MAG: Hsp70 family protein [Micromonosporaceae bacterium]